MASHLITQIIHLNCNYGYRKVQEKTVVNGSGKMENYHIGAAAVKNYLTVTLFINHADVGLAQGNCQMCKFALKSWGKTWGGLHLPNT